MAGKAQAIGASYTEVVQCEGAQIAMTAIYLKFYRAITDN